MTKPLILVSNDDGITAPGLRVLVEIAKKIGRVIVVAPDGPQSGMGHAITVNQPLRVEQMDIFENAEAFQTTGTPVDCVKLAIDKLLITKPDLLLSGINHGNNSSINVIYSGTMSAAVEGAINGIPSIGFSLTDYSYHADFEPAVPYIEKIIHNLLQNPLPPNSLLNVNIPTTKNIKGIKVCRQANAKWEESFEERIDPYGRKYYWMIGNFVNIDNGEDTDVFALSQDYVSIVPTQYDLTDYKSISIVNNWNLNEK
ncbi:MAG: 5'/3'-nucleotidase SurE [Bacteroidetes bacterium]|nr:5'/3'-nucleotidase SurE [Bacteroidota bacterium]